MPPKVILGVVLYGSQYLRQSLPSLLAQDYEHLEIHLLDQEAARWSASKLIQKELPAVLKDPRVQLTQGQNKWHAGGHNTIIQQAIQNGAKYYVTASNDMLYAPDCITRLIAELEKPENSQVGSVAAKLLQWDFEHNKKLNQLDSTGLALTRGHHFSDRGQGQTDTGQYDSKCIIFGASGALAGYRLAALTAVGYYDPRLHYKDDVDLAYRLQWLGWHCRYVPQARAWHARQLSGATRANSSLAAKRDSLVGQILTLQKNFSDEFSLTVQIATGWRRLGIWFYMVASPQLWAVWTTLRSFQFHPTTTRTVDPSKIEELMS